MRFVEDEIHNALRKIWQEIFDKYGLIIESVNFDSSYVPTIESSRMSVKIELKTISKRVFKKDE